MANVQKVNNNQVATTNEELGFKNMQAFQNLQRVANMFNKSSMVPQTFQGEQNLGNAVIAIEMAVRMGVSPLMVMQNLYVVYGNPSWSSKFLIATFNQCGLFSSIKYKFTGKKGTPEYGCVAYATELKTGEKVESINVTMKMANDEGWTSKKGSKWLTMPELMLQYRAATFLIRTVAPEISMGLETAEEVRDRGAIEVEATTVSPEEEIAHNANQIEMGFDEETGEVIDAEVNPVEEPKQKEPEAPEEQSELTFNV
nr:MAG TPA: RecT protein [Caudoviricetes sp.]